MSPFFPIFSFFSLLPPFDKSAPSFGCSQQEGCEVKREICLQENRRACFADRLKSGHAMPGNATPCTAIAFWRVGRE